MSIIFADSQFNPTYLFIAILLGLLLGLVLTKNGKIDKTKIQGLDVKEFLDTKRKGTLVDCRKAQEFENGKIVGAKNYKGTSGAGSGQIRRDIPVFIYDTDGKRAYGIAKKYVRSGCVMVYYMKGGYNAYINNKEGKDMK